MSYDPSTTGPKLPKIAPAAAVGIVLFDANGNLGSCLMSDYLAWVQTQVTDLSASTVLSSLPSDFVALGMTGGAFALAPKSLLGTSGGSSGSNTSGTANTLSITLSSASGTVGSTTTMTVAPGSSGWTNGATVTPTATGVSGTFSPTSATPSGTTPVTFTFTSSAAGTGTLNATATGMTSNGGQTYTATTAAQGGGGSQYPALAFTGTSPVFETANPIYGAASLKVPSGSTTVATGTVTLPANGSGSNQANLRLVFPFRGTGSAPSNGGAFITLSDSNGGNFVLSFAGNSITGSAQGGSSPSANVNIRDGAVHTIELNVYENYNSVYWALNVDGANAANAANGPALVAGPLTVRLMEAAMLAGDVIDNIVIESDPTLTTNPSPAAAPTAAITRNSKTLAIWNFDSQTGAGS